MSAGLLGLRVGVICVAAGLYSAWLMLSLYVTTDLFPSISSFAPLLVLLLGWGLSSILGSRAEEDTSSPPRWAWSHLDPCMTSSSADRHISTGSRYSAGLGGIAAIGLFSSPDAPSRGTTPSTLPTAEAVLGVKGVYRNSRQVP